MNNTFDEMTREVAYASFRAFEQDINLKYKEGLLSRKEARRRLENSRKNYKNLNYNRQLERLIKEIK